MAAGVPPGGLAQAHGHPAPAAASCAQSDAGGLDSASGGGWWKDQAGTWLWAAGVSNGPQPGPHVCSSNIGMTAVRVPQFPPPPPTLEWISISSTVHPVGSKESGGRRPAGVHRVPREGHRASNLGGAAFSLPFRCLLHRLFASPFSSPSQCHSLTFHCLQVRATDGRLRGRIAASPMLPAGGWASFETGDGKSLLLEPDAPGAAVGNGASLLGGAAPLAGLSTHAADGAETEVVETEEAEDAEAEVEDEDEEAAADAEMHAAAAAEAAGAAVAGNEETEEVKEKEEADEEQEKEAEVLSSHPSSPEARALGAISTETGLPRVAGVAEVNEVDEASCSICGLGHPGDASGTADPLAPPPLFPSLL